MQANKIQIITTNNIRYVGKLHNISQEEKSVELRNITCYGTEDRVASDGPIVEKND